MIFLAKLNPTNHIIVNKYIYLYLHITLVTSLSTSELTSNFSESNYNYINKWYKLCSNSTNS